MLACRPCFPRAWAACPRARQSKDSVLVCTHARRTSGICEKISKTRAADSPPAPSYQGQGEIDADDPKRPSHSLRSTSVARDAPSTSNPNLPPGHHGTKLAACRSHPTTQAERSESFETV